MKKTRKPVQVKLSNTVPFHGRTHGTTRAKVELNKTRLQEEGFQGHLIGRVLPNGKVESLTGHNRIQSALELGWDSLPFILEAYTDQEAWTIYTRNNSAADGQSTAWAMGVAKNAHAFWKSQGVAESEIDYKLSGQMGFTPKEVSLFRALAEAVEQGIVVSEIGEITHPLHGLTIFTQVKKYPATLTAANQRTLVERVISNPADATQSVRRIVSEWNIAAAQQSDTPVPARLAKPRKALTLDEKLLNLSIQISKVAEEARQNAYAEVGDDVVQNLRAQWENLNTLFVPGEPDDNSSAS